MSSSRSSGTPEGEDITSVAAHRILSHYEFGSSRVNTALAIVIVLGNDILLLMLVTFSAKVVARKCNGSDMACTFEIQSCLMYVRIKSTSQKDGAPWSEPSCMEKLCVPM